MKDLTVSVIGLELFSKHGWYPEEKILGNRYRVDIDVVLRNWQPADSSDLSQSVNYGQLADIAHQVMGTPTDLLETLADSMIAQIVKLNPAIDMIVVSIQKANPPLGLLCEASRVKITYNKP